MHVLLTTLALAAPKPDLAAFVPDLGGYRVDAEDYCWPTGLRVSVQRDTRQPTVSIVTVVDGGAAADPAGTAGTAHLLEHLWFRAVTAKGDHVDDALVALGASYNAGTDLDATVYQTLAPRDALPALLALESQRLVDPLAGVAAEEVEAERDVVRDELRLGVSGALYALLYPEGHPYHAVVSTPEGMGAVTLAELREAARAWYRPEHATILVVGDVDPGAVPVAVNRMFADPVVGVPMGQVPRGCDGHRPPPAEPPAPVDTSLQRSPAPVSKRTLVIGWSLPPGWGEDDAAMRYAAAYAELRLDDNVDLRGGADLRRRIAPRCMVEPGLRATTMSCVVPLSDALDPDTVVRQIRASVAPNRFDIPDREGLRYVVLAELGDLLRDADERTSPFSRGGSTAALFNHFTGTPTWIGAVAAATENIDRGAIYRLATTYLRPERMVARLLEPDPHVPPAGAGWQSRAEHTWMASEAAAPDLAGLVATPDLSGMREFQLENGLRVRLVRYGDVPIAYAALHMRGGEALAPTWGLHAGADGTTFTRSYNTSFDWTRASWMLGADEWSTVGPTWHEQGVSGPSGNLDGILSLLLETVDQFALYDESREAWVTREMRRLHAVREHPEHWAERLAAGHLFGDHPLGRELDEPVLAAVRKLSDGALLDWARRAYNPAGATLVVVGRIDPDAAEAVVRERMSAWRRPSSTKPIPGTMAPPPEPPGRRTVLLDAPGLAQPQVRLACQVGPVDEAAPEAALVLRTLAHDAVWRALRVRAPVAYDPGADLGWWEGGGARLDLAASVRPDAVAPGVDALLGAVHGLHAGDFDDARLAQAKAYDARSYALGLVTGRQMLDRLLWLGDRDPRAWFAGKEARIAAVDRAAVTRLLDRCEGHEFVSVVGPAEALAGVQGERFDWKAESDRLWKAYDPDGFRAAHR